MRRRDLTRRRSIGLALAVAIAGLAACSSDSPDASDRDVAVAESNPFDRSSTTTAPSTDPAGTSDDQADAPDDTPEPWTLQVDYAIVAADGGNGGRDGLAGSFDPLAADDPLDPFTELDSCSGWRSSVTAYSLFAHGDDSTRLVSLSVSDAVAGPGTYDALVRIERDDGAVDFVGTATLAADLRSGEFLAFGAAGERIDGAFRCAGTESPEPLELGDPEDDRVDTVEVSALLRRDGQVVIVGLTTDAVEGAVCEVDGGSVVVSVEGGPEIGSMTSFELSGEPVMLRATVGGTEFVFDTFERLDVAPDDSVRASGTFGADADGVEIDGAFRCT